MLIRMKRLKLLSNISFIIAFLALGIVAAFHGYGIHPENVAAYQLGVTMEILQIQYIKC